MHAAGDGEVSADGEGDEFGEAVSEGIAEGLTVGLPADGAAPPQATRRLPAAMLNAIRFTTKGATAGLLAWLRVVNRGGR